MSFSPFVLPLERTIGTVTVICFPFVLAVVSPPLEVLRRRRNILLFGCLIPLWWFSLVSLGIGNLYAGGS